MFVTYILTDQTELHDLMSLISFFEADIIVLFVPRV